MAVSVVRLGKKSKTRNMGNGSNRGKMGNVNTSKMHACRSIYCIIVATR